MPGAPTDGAIPPEHDAESLGDPRVRELLERYAALVGGSVREVEPHVLEFDVPSSEHRFFSHAEQLDVESEPVRIAFSVDSLERHPDAEMAAVGSDFFYRLITAVQARGHKMVWGIVPPSDWAGAPSTAGPTPALDSLDLEVHAATVEADAPAVRLHPGGRLLARVMVRAGTAVEEHLVQSRVFDLSSGTAVEDAAATVCEKLVSGDVQPLAPEGLGNLAEAAAKPADDLMDMLLHDLGQRLEDRIEEIRTEAQGTLERELHRIERYYLGMVADRESSGRPPTAAEQQAIETDRARRRAEEERRHEVRATVHPVQLEEWQLLVQSVEWRLTSPSRHEGVLAARRTLSGSGTWEVTCPTCGGMPSEVSICIKDHVTCNACGNRCSVCTDSFCREHGIGACHVDGRPACEEHASLCTTCKRQHCTEHQGVCAENEHAACSTCLAACAACGRVVCDDHAVHSAGDAPRGRRRLCHACVVYCEGGTKEPVGRDEAAACASCEHFVCEWHQATCEVDGRVHCSKHLRRSDRSRRLICEAHHARCNEEPSAILASDEVEPCGSCGKMVCDRHGQVCSGHGVRLCVSHLKPLLDTQGEMGCAEHRAECHVDAKTYSLSGVAPCPACTKSTCRSHTTKCANCGRRVCIEEFPSRERTCVTCSRLVRVTDPDDDLMTAALEANGGEPVSAKSWEVNQDAGHRVVNLRLGWARRLVFTVRHGDASPDTVMRHGWLGTKRLR
jgi:hypothetical protein